jgi:hypothetical protein
VKKEVAEVEEAVVVVEMTGLETVRKRTKAQRVAAHQRKRKNTLKTHQKQNANQRNDKLKSGGAIATRFTVYSGACHHPNFVENGLAL